MENENNVTQELLYREKYTKEEFKKKIEDTFYHGDYGFKLELKEQDDSENPYYYELTRGYCYIDGFEFKEDLFLSYEDSDYLYFDIDRELRIDSDEWYFAIYSNQLEKFTLKKLKELEIEKVKNERLREHNERLRGNNENN